MSLLMEVIINHKKLLANRILNIITTNVLWNFFD
jgi:hypothetical protein